MQHPWPTPNINSVCVCVCVCVILELSDTDVGLKSPQQNRWSQPRVWVCAWVEKVCICRLACWSVIENLFIFVCVCVRACVRACVCVTVTVASHRSCRVHEQRPHHHYNHVVCQRSSMGVYVLMLSWDWPVCECECVCVCVCVFLELSDTDVGQKSLVYLCPSQPCVCVGNSKCMWLYVCLCLHECIRVYCVW